MPDHVVVIDYGAGNLCSVENALRVAAGVEATITVSGSPAAIRAADRLVLPGVGAFAQCIGALKAAPGVLDALTVAVRQRAVPFLGICVGMQLLADEGREHGVHPGLGWIGGAVERLAPADQALKVPHMGWNTVAFARDHAALSGVPRGQRAYFVHSYRLAVADPADTVAATDHGGEIAAIVGRDNILGVQFHPEKSQAFGLSVLRGFLGWRP
ncbi:MAG: imidazole glycerol phosphate synthase subunit HisH [Sphingomonadaceae bacterium]|nr:imidazole glycerol phosphate synthase subunit HisH [Sphingomonadaceae bacterium]